nr:diguanylate cyclase [bacterium]
IFTFSIFTFLLTILICGLIGRAAAIQLDSIIFLKNIREKNNIVCAEIDGTLQMIPLIESKIDKFKSLNESSMLFYQARSIDELLQTFIDLLNKNFGNAALKKIKILQYDMLEKKILINSNAGANEIFDFDKLDYMIMENNSPLICRDAGGDYRIANILPPEVSIFKSIVVIPIIKDNMSVGVVRLESKEKNFFTTESLRYADYLTNLMFMNFQNLLLHKKSVELAETDGLTGLYKRWYFDNAIKTETNRAFRYNQLLSLIMIDVDDFRKFNNNYGHLAGDKTLEIISKIIKRNSPKTSIACRYGGEEISVILPDYDNNRAFEIAETIRKKIFTESHILENETISISLGLAELSKLSLKTPDFLINVADSALYEAKNSGKNKTVYKEK